MPDTFVFFFLLLAWVTLVETIVGRAMLHGKYYQKLDALASELDDFDIHYITQKVMLATLGFGCTFALAFFGSGPSAWYILWLITAVYSTSHHWQVWINRGLGRPDTDPDEERSWFLPFPEWVLFVGGKTWEIPKPEAGKRRKPVAFIASCLTLVLSYLIAF